MADTFAEQVGDNERATIGGNNPPPPTPFDVVKNRIETLYGEAKLWIDGQAIETQGQADALTQLRNMMREAFDDAEEVRKAEKKPFDEMVAEIQARYAPLTGDTKKGKGMAPRAIEEINGALTPWLQKLEQELLEIAEIARKEAEAAALAAQAAIRASAGNLEARDNAEVLVRDAKEAEAAAKSVEKLKATAGGSYGRSSHLRIVNIAEVTDMREFARWCWANDTEELTAFLKERAQKLTDVAIRGIPGVTVRQEKRAR
jgi:hypothetical protein